MDFYYLTGIVGCALILFAFLMGQSGRWKEDDLIYDVVNFFGSTFLVIFAVSGGLWPFIILNSVWGLYSLHDIVADLKNEGHKKYHILKPSKVHKDRSLSKEIAKIQEEMLFMEEAVNESEKGIFNNKGGPFGAVVVKDGVIVGRGYNQVTSSNDPTNHAEIVAIRDACKKLKTFQLTGCELYTSCEPCPMCFGAIYWARPDKVYYSNTRKDAAKISFDDDFIYRELNKTRARHKIPFERLVATKALKVFREWEEKEDKVRY